MKYNTMSTKVFVTSDWNHASHSTLVPGATIHGATSLMKLIMMVMMMVTMAGVTVGMAVVSLASISTPDGTVTLREANTCSALSLRSLP